jgi:hypothetical protein
LFFVSVTVVESARRALQFLGLDGENSDVGFDVSKLCFWIINFAWMLIWNLLMFMLLFCYVMVAGCEG